MSPGSIPLKNTRHERFAQQRALGVNPSESWASTFPSDAKIPNRNSLKVTACVVGKRPDVSARINYLLKEKRVAEARLAAEIPTFDRITKRQLIDLTLEITEILEVALEKASTSSIAPTTLARLKSVLSAHLARQGRLSEEHPEIIDDGKSNEIVNKFNKLEFCTCNQTP
mgnify:CR=1 FL=1